VNNPYTPPAAGVADVPGVVRIRPRAVNIALLLIAAGLLAQLLVQLWFLQQAGFWIGDPWQSAVSVGLFALYGFICHQLAKGRSWPRIVLLILTVVGFASTCYAIGVMRRLEIPVTELLWTPIFLFNRVVPMILNFIALHLLYFESGGWFRERSG
jgi:hypothetical protein